MRGGILAPNWPSPAAKSVSSCVARPRPGSLGARRSFARRRVVVHGRPRPRPTIAQPASLGVKSSGLGRATAGEILGGHHHGSFRGATGGRGWQEVPHLCVCLTSDTRWNSIRDNRDLPPDIRNSRHRSPLLALFQSRELQRTDYPVGRRMSDLLSLEPVPASGYHCSLWKYGRNPVHPAANGRANTQMDRYSIYGPVSECNQRQYLQLC